jgi:hypothetical protein
VFGGAEKQDVGLADGQSGEGVQHPNGALRSQSLKSLQIQRNNANESIDSKLQQV